jgi:hypothetical protein
MNPDDYVNLSFGPSHLCTAETRYEIQVIQNKISQGKREREREREKAQHQKLL